MSYASRSGRARTNSAHPQAFAVCDRCGIWHNFVDLSWQYDWRGATKQNLRFLVCHTCMDIPQQQLRAIVLPADPLPIVQARVEPFQADETDWRTKAEPAAIDPKTGIPIPGVTTFTIQNGATLTTDPMGSPVGLAQSAIMPLNGIVHYGVDLQPISITANGTTIITCTCRVPHGLSTGSQISVEGLTDPRATGFYSVTAMTAVMFKWTVIPIIPSGSLLTPTTRLVTASVGLPYDYPTIPAADETGTI